VVLNVGRYLTYVPVGLGVFYWVVPTRTLLAFTSGAVIGSLLYDGFHYAFHHGPNLDCSWFQYMKAAHMRHHFRDNTVEFGVTTDLWDYLLDSKPKVKGA
jgi:sterol desaturase/sphingolipid hydroxylase (fatty acid hydroxylase superfamily)